MISERSNDGLERTAETWFKRYNGKAPERGGARKCPTSSKECSLSPDVTVTWTGTCYEGRAQGEGTLKWVWEGGNQALEEKREASPTASRKASG